MSRSAAFWIFVFLFAISGLTAMAQADSAAQEANVTNGCVESFDASTDYFPHKVSVEFAQNFTVEYFNHYKIVSLLPWPGAEEPEQYLLVQCGTPVPDGYGDLPVIEVPVNRFVGMTTSILPHLTAQNLLDRLVGVDTVMFTSSQDVVSRVNAGEIAEIGGGGTGGEINFEILLGLSPDLVMAQEFFAGGTSIAQLQQAGLTAVLNADYADTTPLGQAEWGKYIALFFNTEAEANTIFEGVAARYQALAALASEVEYRPTVIAASPYSGTWYMPAADSTIAQLLTDAGGDFLFADEPGTSVPLDVEVVLERGVDAQYWVNVNQFWNTRDDMLADDSRFAQFAAVQSGSVWNNNARMNANGGSDYFEGGAANPDLILADLIHILHPELLPDHRLVYYRLLDTGN